MIHRPPHTAFPVLFAMHLEHRLETRTSTRTADSAPILHANIRGSRYYH